SQLSQLQTFLIDGFRLSLDTIENTITLSGATKEEIAAINSKVFPLENYVADTSSLSIRLSVEEKGNTRVLTIQNDFQPEIKSISIYYDPATYLVEHTEIQWWKGLILDRVTDAKKYWLSDIRFTEKHGTQMNVKNEMDKIMTRKGNELSLTEKYKNYRVIALPSEKPVKEN
ncbi:MAG TPA: hypothetical protein VFI06_04000, partial [Chitinophagaceae bacterium]|nr:hypothetical protein [Chitinophagaceae bacterium]